MEYKKQWIPACAGMTVLQGINLTHRRHPDAGRGPLCSEHFLRLNIKNISTFPSGGGVPTGRGGLFYSFLFFQSPPTQDGNFLFAKLKHRHSRAGGNPLRSDNFWHLNFKALCHCEQTPVCVAIQFYVFFFRYRRQWNRKNIINMLCQLRKQSRAYKQKTAKRRFC